MYRLPENSDWMVEQNLHEPTRSYAEDIHNFVKRHPYHKALEIGCIWGVSTITILTSGKGTLLSVDPIPQNNPAMHAMVEVRLNQLKDRWDYYTGRSEAFWMQLPASEMFDLIYVDGSHIYGDVYTDLFNAWDHLEPGGLLMVDDFIHKHNRTGEYGVSLAVLELIADKGINSLECTKQVMAIKKPWN